MKSVLLIGLGRFGRQMAEKLRELRHQILAVTGMRAGSMTFCPW